MGEIRNVQCSACGATWRCLEGSGLLYGKKESIIEAFVESERAVVTAQIEKSEIPAYGFDFRLTVCNHCHNVVAVPVLVTGEDETYEGHCPLCGKKTASPPEDLEKEPCPVCKIKALKTEIEGHWD